mgnify:CR=1 FL=1
MEHLFHAQGSILSCFCLLAVADLCLRTAITRQFDLKGVAGRRVPTKKTTASPSEAQGHETLWDEDWKSGSPQSRLLIYSVRLPHPTCEFRRSSAPHSIPRHFCETHSSTIPPFSQSVATSTTVCSWASTVRLPVPPFDTASALTSADSRSARHHPRARRRLDRHHFRLQPRQDARERGQDGAQEGDEREGGHGHGPPARGLRAPLPPR